MSRENVSTLLDDLNRLNVKVAELTAELAAAEEEARVAREALERDQREPHRVGPQGLAGTPCGGPGGYDKRCVRCRADDALDRIAALRKGDKP